MMRVVRDFVSVVLFVALAVPAVAQSSHTAAIVVVVFDATGAPVKEAAITVANADLGTSRELTPDATGTITATNLGLQGSYTISVRQPGAAADDKGANPHRRPGGIAAASGRNDADHHPPRARPKASPRSPWRAEKTGCDGTPPWGCASRASNWTKPRIWDAASRRFHCSIPPFARPWGQATSS